MTRQTPWALSGPIPPSPPKPWLTTVRPICASFSRSPPRRDKIGLVATDRIDLVTVLGKTALLSGLSAPELQSLAAITVRKRYGAGELLFSEGDACNGLYIVSRGRVRIFKT